MTATKIYDASNPIHQQSSTTFVIKNPGLPATDAQLSFLSSLIASRESDLCPKVAFAMASKAVTKGRASEWITVLKAAPVKSAQTYTQVAAEYKATVAVANEEPTPAFGYYAVGDQLFHFEMFKGQFGGMKPKLYKLIKGQTWSTKLGKYVPKGKWAWTGGELDAKVKLGGGKGTKITVAEAGKLGLAFGFCIRCGRYLSDPVSVANGIGPVCATYAGW